MKKIQVLYWKHKYSELDIEHGTEFEYSQEFRETLIDLILSKGLSIMLKLGEETLYVWIDKGRFGQS